MKVLVIFLFLIITFVGCARATSVTVTWTNSKFNTVSPNLCSASADTLKDLARGDIFIQQSGRTDSTLITSMTLVGREGLVDSTFINLNEGTWLVWMYLFDNKVPANKSCKSNIISKTIIQSPVAAVMQ